MASGRAPHGRKAVPAGKQEQESVGNGLREKAVWHVVRKYARTAGIERLAPHDLRRKCARLCHSAGGELEQIQFLLGHVSIQTTERYLAASSAFAAPSMTAAASNRKAELGLRVRIADNPPGRDANATPFCGSHLKRSFRMCHHSAVCAFGHRPEWYPGWRSTGRASATGPISKTEKIECICST